MHTVILTKSPMQKNGKQGLCVTAYAFESRSLIRMVDTRFDAPVSYGFASGFDVMDLIECSIAHKCPKDPQTENVDVYYKSIRNLGHYAPGIADIYERLRSQQQTDVSYMDIDGHKLDSVERFHHSIELLRVSKLAIVQSPFGGFKAEFEYNGRCFRYFSITDPNYNFKKGGRSIYIGDAYIVVSIPNVPYIDKNGTDRGYFKFIAAVYPI